MRADGAELADAVPVEPSEETPHRDAVGGPLFGLRMLAVKKSRKRRAARSPAAATIGGTSIDPAAGSTTAIAVVWSGPLSGTSDSAIGPPGGDSGTQGKRLKSRGSRQVT
jgi:hypothetical protein